VFAGGCFGAAARYWVSLQLPTPQDGFPAGTCTINLLGAFLLGFLLEGLARLGDDSGPRRIARLAVGTGFMGAFTTYSTLAVEMTLLLRSNNPVVAGWYACTSVLGGTLCSTLGILAAASHHKHKGAKR
jgi:CrcB protein